MSNRKFKLFKSEKFENIFLMSGFFLIAIVSVVLFVINSDFILREECVDLNKIMANNEKMPKFGYVEYTCKIPLGCYGYEQDYHGTKPSGDKGYYYAFLDDSGAILSVETEDKDYIAKIEALGNGDIDSVTVKGKVTTNMKKMDKFLKEHCEGIADGDNIRLTSYTIKTESKEEARREVIAGLVIGMAGGVFFLIRLIRSVT